MIKVLGHTVGMYVGFDDPQRVGFDGVLVASDLLLLETPRGKLDLVREEIAPSQCMPKPEHRAQSPETLGRLRVTPVASLDLHDPVVVRVPRKIRHTVRRHLVLEIDLGDWGTEVVRVETLLGRKMAKLDARAVFDVVQAVKRFPVLPWNAFLGRIGDAPVVVLVSMGVKGNLLF